MIFKWLPAFAAAACLATPAVALDCEEGFRAFAHHAGETCIPENPQRIVTLQDQNGLLPLMELGVTPIASAGHINSAGERVFRRMQGYDTTGIEWIGTYGEPDIESVAAQEPDLIIASPWPEDVFETYSRIAPTIVIDMFGQPLDDALFQFADAVNRTGRAEELQAEFEAKAVSVREELGSLMDSTTVSFITYRPDDQNFYPVNPTQASGMIFEVLQPVRPATESVDQQREYRSMETLGDHAADVMFQYVFDADEGGDSDVHAAFLDEPLVQALPVVQAGQLFPLDSSQMVGSAWGKAMNGLDQISRVLLRDDLNRNLVQE